MVHIVRPVKRDWAVLSKDTPVDISILKSVYSPVKRFTPVYTYSSYEPFCEKRAFRINLDHKHTD